MGIPGYIMLFHCSIYLSLCQHLIVLISFVEVLKPGILALLGLKGKAFSLSPLRVVLTVEFFFPQFCLLPRFVTFVLISRVFKLVAPFLYNLLSLHQIIPASVSSRCFHMLIACSIKNHNFLGLSYVKYFLITYWTFWIFTLWNSGL